MGKNKQKKQQGRSFADQIKMKDGKLVNGLTSDVYQDAEKRFQDHHKGVPSEEILSELVNEKKEDVKKKLKWAMFEEYSDLVKQLENTGPDLEPTIDSESGKESSARYSKKAYEERTKLLNRFESLKEAIEDAYKQHSFDKLEEYCKNYNK